MWSAVRACYALLDKRASYNYDGQQIVAPSVCIRSLILASRLERKIVCEKGVVHPEALSRIRCLHW